MSSLLAAADVVRQLRSEIRGRVIGPDGPEYDRARTVFYSGFDRRPAAVVRAADAGDVARVVSRARESDLPLAVRSGGHSIAGHGTTDGGLLLDLSALRRLEIDRTDPTAWADAGLTAGAYTASAGAHGLATGFGDSPSVGIGGITLGGGIGFLHRRYGLTIDHLLAAEVVTAEGELVYTDAASHPDLFWAIRGGGGNFGVVTRFRFRLHPLERVLAGLLIFPATPELITELVGAADSAPEDLAGLINVAHAPPMPMIPPEHHGRPIVLAHLVHAGRIEEGEREIARLRALATPIVDTVAAVAYPAVYEGGGGPKPVQVAARSTFLDHVDRSAAETILDALQRSRATMRVVQIRVLGGAVARVPPDATAFAHRQRRILAVTAAAYEDPAEAAEHEAWSGGLAAALRQGEAGAYVSFMGDEGEARLREAYPGATWERLRAIKMRYDPGNLFRLNVNVPPG